MKKTNWTEADDAAFEQKKEQYRIAVEEEKATIVRLSQAREIAESLWNDLIEMIDRKGLAQK